jgi:hypothetical protein
VPRLTPLLYGAARGGPTGTNGRRPRSGRDSDRADPEIRSRSGDPAADEITSLTRQAPRLRRPGAEPPAGQQARARAKLLLSPTACSHSLPIAPRRGIGDLPREYVVCPASCLAAQDGGRRRRLASEGDGAEQGRARATT